VQVGTANFVDPFIWSKLLDGMRDTRAPRTTRLADLVGTRQRIGKKQCISSVASTWTRAHAPSNCR
jgi:hypothetical protein